MTVWRRAWYSLALAGCLLSLLCGATAASAAPRGRTVVVLVSGLDSTSPFTTPAPTCAGKEGSTWGLKGGVAQALRRAGFDVYTAPVRPGSARLPSPCARLAPGPSTWLDSTGDVGANGRALDRFLAFLHRAYHVGSVTLLGHSDGGLWSRSALAMRRSAPSIGGLVTLGTPHTGSPVADLGTLLANIDCGSAAAACTTFQALARALVKQLGPTAVGELTSSFLATWNPHLKLGGCRVTVIQGTAIQAAALRPPQPRLSGYYLPSDGLVGLSSASDQPARALDGTEIPAATIGRLVNGGAFRAFHTPAIGSPSELNDSAVNTALIRALRQAPSPCTSSRTSRPSRLVVRLVTVRQSGARGGSLGSSSSGDVVLAASHVSVACGRSTLTASPLLPVPLLKTYVAGTCAQLSSNGPALLLHNTASGARLMLSGTNITVIVKGPKIRGLSVQAMQRGMWVRVALKGGRGRVPGGNLVQLRLTGRTAAGALVSASAAMTS